MRPCNIVEIPVQSPGTCLRCKSSKTPNRDYFLDTGTEVDYVGVVYFCDKCLLDFVNSAPDCYTQGYLDAVIAANAELYENSLRSVQEYQEVKDALKAIGLDANILLEKARGYKKDLDATPALKQQLAETKVEVKEKEALVKSAEAKLEALSQYIGVEKTIEQLEAQVNALTHERNVLLQEKEMFSETLERVVAEANNLQEENLSDPDEDIEEEDLAAVRAQADVPTPVEIPQVPTAFVGLSIGEIVVPK